MAVDIEGNCRFYDLIRFRKMAKVNVSSLKIGDQPLGTSKFQLLTSNIVMTNDSLLGVIQSNHIYKDFEADAKFRAEWEAE